MKKIRTLSQSLLLASLTISTLCASSDPSFEAAAPAGPARPPQEKVARLKKIDCILALSSPFLQPITVDAQHLPEPGSPDAQRFLKNLSYRGRLTLTGLNPLAAFRPGYETLLARTNALSMTFRTHEALETAGLGLAALGRWNSIDTANLNIRLSAPDNVLGISSEHVGLFLQDNPLNFVKNLSVRIDSYDLRSQEQVEIMIKSSRFTAEITVRDVPFNRSLLPILKEASERNGFLDRKELSLQIPYPGSFSDEESILHFPGIFEGAFGAQIVSLELTGRTIANEDLQTLANLRALERLDISDCLLSTDTLGSLLRLENLSNTVKTLDLSGARVDLSNDLNILEAFSHARPWVKLEALRGVSDDVLGGLKDLGVAPKLPPIDLS
ncbi:MAG: hypothetical protein H6849_04490 [Alphaproteobacteria bacterium]|nr:MAG: hypothetical protein H6849_04490 [Alphaproteobacteria bacterium]